MKHPRLEPSSGRIAAIGHRPRARRWIILPAAIFPAVVLLAAIGALRLADRASAAPALPAASAPAPAAAPDQAPPGDAHAATQTPPQWTASAHAPATLAAAPATMPASMPALASATMPATAPAPAPVARESYYRRHRYGRSAADTVLPAEFQILDQRSIFSRNKRAIQSADEDQPPPTASEYHPISLTATIVLTGVVVATPQSGGPDEYQAVFEDMRAGKAFTLRAKEKVATGILADITLDYVDFQANGQMHRVYIGENLDGLPTSFSQAVADGQSGSAAGGAATGPSASSSGSSAGSAGASASPDTTQPQETPNQESIIERLRARRAREGG